MAATVLQISEKLMNLAKSRAIDAGYEDVSEFVSQLILSEAAEAPAALEISSDADLERLLQQRKSGPFVPMDGHDFKQMREKLATALSSPADNH